MPDVTTRRSRRALLGCMVAGLAAAAASGLGRAGPASADDGPVRLGAANTSDSGTRITRTTGGPAFVAEGSGPGVGVAGLSEIGIAVYGVSAAGKGVIGTSEDGIALEGASPDGIALHVPHGRVWPAGVSGVVRIAAGDVVAIVRPAARIPPG